MGCTTQRACIVEMATCQMKTISRWNCSSTLRATSLGSPSSLTNGTLWVQSMLAVQLAETHSLGLSLKYWTITSLERCWSSELEKSIRDWPRLNQSGASLKISRPSGEKTSLRYTWPKSRKEASPKTTTQTKIWNSWSKKPTWRTTPTPLSTLKSPSSKVQ